MFKFKNVPFRYHIVKTGQTLLAHTGQNPPQCHTQHPRASLSTVWFFRTKEREGTKSTNTWGRTPWTWTCRPAAEWMVSNGCGGRKGEKAKRRKDLSVRDWTKKLDRLRKWTNCSVSITPRLKSKSAHTYLLCRRNCRETKGFSRCHCSLSMLQSSASLPTTHVFNARHEF